MVVTFNTVRKLLAQLEMTTIRHADHKGSSAEISISLIGSQMRWIEQRAARTATLQARFEGG